MPMPETTAQVLQTGMTVAQVMEILKNANPEAVVLFQVDYGDHCHTQQLLHAEDHEVTDSNSIHETAYSQTGIARRDPGYEEDYEDENDDHPIPVIIFS